MKDIKDQDSLSEAIMTEQFRRFVLDTMVGAIGDKKGILPGLHFRMVHPEGSSKPWYGMIPMAPEMFESSSSKTFFREMCNQVVNNISKYSPGSKIIATIFLNEMWYLTLTPKQLAANGGKAPTPSQSKERQDGIMMCVETVNHQEMHIYKVTRDKDEELISIDQTEAEMKMGKDIQQTGRFSNILYKPELFEQEFSEELKELRKNFKGFMGVEIHGEEDQDD